MQEMYHPSDLAAMDPLVLMKNLDHVRMTSRRLSYILQQQVHLYTPAANEIRDQIDRYVEAERQIEGEMARRKIRARAAPWHVDQPRSALARAYQCCPAYGTPAHGCAGAEWLSLGARATEVPTPSLRGKGCSTHKHPPGAVDENGHFGPISRRRAVLRVIESDTGRKVGPQGMARARRQGEMARRQIRA